MNRDRYRANHENSWWQVDNDQNYGHQEQPHYRRSRHASGGSKSTRGNGNNYSHTKGSMGQNQSIRDGNHRNQHHASSKRACSIGRKPVTNPTFDFPFFKNEDSIHYINSSKVMLILRGLAGSGKTTLANNLEAVYNRVSICSADDFFMSRDGTYHFDGSRLREAHDSCKSRAWNACKGNRFNVVIIDNTNIQKWELDYYLDLAKATNFVALLVEPKTSWRWNLEQLERKNIHNISLASLERKLEMYEDIIPVYHGWFLNEADSEALHSIGQAYMDECFRNHNFKMEFRPYLSNSKDLKEYFFKNSLPEKRKLFHCTSNSSKDQGQVDYPKQKSVLNAQGKAFDLHIIGFVITPRTFGARIKLDENCLKLWNQNDSATRMNAPSPDILTSAMKDLRLDEVTGRKMPQRSAKKWSSISIPSLHWKKHNLPVEKRFNPTFGRGSRAHITLGCGKDANSVQTGYDLVNVINLEKKAKQHSSSRLCFNVQNGVACNYGNGQWVIYLDKQIETKALFAGSY